MPRLSCRESQISSLSRGRHFVRMLRHGLRHMTTTTTTNATTTTTFGGGDVPILIKHDDGNGCLPYARTDRYDYPRLTWSIPVDYYHSNAKTTTTTIDDTRRRGDESSSSSSRDAMAEGGVGVGVGGRQGGPPPPRVAHRAHGTSDWCSAIGMPSYKAWKDACGNANGMPPLTNIDVNAMYPWDDKLPLAIWRGSTTRNTGIYGRLPFWDMPRSMLVRHSLDRPDLIDAGYHKLVGKYGNAKDINGDGGGGNIASSSPVLKDAVPLNDMMRYKGKWTIGRGMGGGRIYVFFITNMQTNMKGSLSIMHHHRRHHLQNNITAIIDIDGNNWSARFPSLLCTNSVIIKIAPDFVDQYASELVPNLHYVPSSLDNITNVVEYVLDSRNDDRMRDIVNEANGWCVRHLGKASLATKAVRDLYAYRDALRRYGVDGWESPNYDDMVECDV